MKRISLEISLVVLLVLALLAGACAKPAPAPEEQEFIIVSAGAGGKTYECMVAVADIVTKYCPGVKATSIASTGTPANIMQAEFIGTKAWFTNASLGQLKLVRGEPPCEKKYTNLRFVAGFAGTGYMYASLDPNIKETKDLIGKTIALGPEGWTTTSIYSEALKLEGIFDKATIKYLGYEAGANALMDGLVDGIFINATVTPDLWLLYAAQIAQVAQIKPEKFHVFAPSEQVLKQAMANTGYPLGWGICPAGSFPNQTESLTVPTMTNPCLGCFHETDEDLVYLVTKTLCEESHRFKEYLPAWGHLITPEEMIGLLAFLNTDPVFLTDTKAEHEIHPGAWKYYTEVGLADRLYK